MNPRTYRLRPVSGLLVALLLTAALLGCGGRGGNLDAIMTDAVYNESIPVETLSVTAQPFEEQYGAAGVVEAEEEVTISSELSGRVVTLTREIGETVRAGQLLVELDDRSHAAQVHKLEAEVARARTQLEWARRDLERQKRLFETRVAAERALDNAQRELDTSENDLASRIADLEVASVELGRTHIKSPISGAISKRYTSVGEYVTPGTKLYDVVAVSTVKFVFSVAERDVTGIRPGSELPVTVDAHAGRTFVGTIGAVAPSGSQGTRTFRVEVLLDNQSEAALLPGMSGQAAVIRSRYDNVLLIPESAILRDGKSSYIFVNSTPNEDTGAARRVDVTIVGQTGSFGVVDVSAGKELEIIILGQAAVADGTPIRVRRRHASPPQTIFD